MSFKLPGIAKGTIIPSSIQEKIAKENQNTMKNKINKITN